MEHRLSVIIVSISMAFQAFTTMAALADSHSVGYLINERLSYMKDVAGDKAQHHQAIEDLAQEKKVLQKATADAEALGLKGESVKAFVQAQMDAAKAIQYRYRADWLAVPETTWQPRPLNEVRNKIGPLSYTILQKLAGRLKSGETIQNEREIFMKDIRQKNLNDQDKLLIWNALKSISLK